MDTEIKELKQRLSKLTVLYVEDEENMRLGTEIFLNKFFSSVETAVDGEAGLNKYIAAPSDIVFTDILMPNMDGLEMLGKILKINKDVFCVALTASDVSPDDINRKTSLYFRKPVTYENMLVIMRSIADKLNL
ncbi:MAG: response regulator [Campylobacterota bacterium]|nr:response regulator [Campylobacterota bacterium]